MPKYLTQEWMDTAKQLASEFPETPGASVRMQQVVTGAPDGDIKYYTVIENGKTVEQTLGEDPNAEVEKGFQDGIMPNNYEDTLKPEEIKALTDYLVEVATK